MLLAKLLKALCQKHAHRLHHAENVGHCAYLGSVAMFAHGPYAVAAGVLLVLVVLAMLAGE